MNKLLIILLCLNMCSINRLHAQKLMTPELLWQLGRVSGIGISKDEKSVVYNVSTPNASEK